MLELHGIGDRGCLGSLENYRDHRDQGQEHRHSGLRRKSLNLGGLPWCDQVVQDP